MLFHGLGSCGNTDIRQHFLGISTQNLPHDLSEHSVISDNVFLNFDIAVSKFSIKKN